MLEQEQQHIPDAAIRTGGDDEFPLTARNQACRTFKINGIVSVDAGIEILHHIGKIAFHDITLIQLGNAQLELLRGDGDIIGNAVHPLGICLADCPLKFHEAAVAQRSGKADDGRIADVNPFCNLRRGNKTRLRKIIQYKIRNKLLLFCQLYTHELRS